MKTIGLPIEQPKLWILDVDGVIFIHNSHLKGKDELVPGFMNFYKQIRAEDFIVIITARDKKYEAVTRLSLKKNNIRFNKIIFDAPKGERVLINDNKPDGARTGFALNVDRDKFPGVKIKARGMLRS
jgi:hypothetical protein